MIDGSIFTELALVIILAMGVSTVMRIIRQPLIIGYILTGILASPLVFNMVSGNGTTIGNFSHFGVALLLFIVGINLNPKVIKDFGLVSLVTGICQLAFTIGLGILMCRFFGFDIISSTYISVALAFSSTIIIMKLLSDKGDLDALYGRIAIGFLIVQDVIAILALMIVSSPIKELTLATFALEIVLKGVGLLAIVFLVSYFIFPRLDNFISRSQEYLFLFSVGWCLLLSILFNYAGFTIEIGALIAGISLSMSPSHYEISSKIRPLRDFFLILFFIFLGSQISFTNITPNAIPIIVLSLFVLIGNPVIMMILMGLLGYTKSNSFKTGISIAQVSEFSLILVALGVGVGHITHGILSIVTIIGLITIAGSSYFILYSDKLYSFLSPVLGVFEFRKNKVDEHRYHKNQNYDVIVFGYNRIGFSLVETFKKLKKEILIIDFNPNIIKDLALQGTHCKYGDANNIEILNELKLNKTKMILSTIPNTETNTLIIKRVKAKNPKAIIVVVSHRIKDALDLYKVGATYVLLPHFLGGNYVGNMIEKYGFKISKFNKEQKDHKKYLIKRKELGHKHPVHERPRN